MTHQNVKKLNSRRQLSAQKPSFPNIFGTIQKGLDKVSHALTVDIEPITHPLSCIEKKEFDFLKLEGDVNQIHHELSFNTRGDQVVGTYVTLNVDASPYVLELETHFYNQIRKENLKNSQTFRARSIKNVPEDLLQELEDDGNFRIYFDNQQTR